MNITWEQLSLFPDELPINQHSQDRKRLYFASAPSAVSERLLESFHVSDIHFFGCDFDDIYPKLNKIIPGDTVLFAYTDINTFIASEMVCAAICHQINWDYLRKAVFKKTLQQPKWLEAEALSVISESEVTAMLADYNKPERIRANQRTRLLQSIGMLASRHKGFMRLFLSESGVLLSEEQIRNNLLECIAFSEDPGEKKLQLLFQKLSNHPRLADMARFSKPAVDYHLVRCFLRRGLISPKTKLGVEFIDSVEIQRHESTVGALRQLCGHLIQDISSYTGLSISAINQIEWHVGRSICTEKKPDCFLEYPDADWIRGEYSMCPFNTTCCALNYNQKLLHIMEPNYIGTSY